MNETTINIDGQEYFFKFYEKFINYYADNGKHVEPTTRQWFLDNLTENDIVFDIGAHIGLYTTLFSRRTNNVYAFEPTSTYDTLLLPNLEKNNITNVKTEKLAIGKKSGVFTERVIRICCEDFDEQDYQFTTLDDYIDSTGIVPTHMKIDVDGFDLEVLQGGEKFLKEHNPTICVEIGDNTLSTRGYTGKDLYDYIVGLGYKEIHRLDYENFIFQK